MNFTDKLNDTVGDSFVGKFFEIKERGSTFTTELAGATATFLSMAYILAVNPRILADSGGPCVADPNDPAGIFGEAYEACLETIKQQFVTSTAVASMIACFLMGIVANLPIALSAGMGINAYFTYSVVGFRGTGNVSYGSAVSAVAIEGAIFFLLSITGLRYRLTRMIPEPVRIATPAGIGAFLAHLGLQSAEGIGIVVGDIATTVTLGGCPAERRTPMVAYDELCATQGICIFGDNYTCATLGGIMKSGTTWVGILGLLIIAIFMSYKSKLAFIYGIGFVTIISWFRNTAITYFPNDDIGNARFDYFKQVVAISPIDKIIVPYSGDLSAAGLALFTFLYVDFLESSGSFLGILNSMGVIDKDGEFPKSTQAFCVDGLCTVIGSIFGLSPLTCYIESAAGVEAGAKTGLTACIVGFYFFLSIFFAPVFASIPPWAIGGALIMVGSLMARSLTELKWDKVSHAVSGFLTVMVMPLTYSIAYGLIAGIMVFAVMESVFWILSFAGVEVPGDEPDNHTLIEEPAEGEAAEKEDVENFAEKKKEKAENSAQDEPEFAESGNKNVGGES